MRQSQAVFLAIFFSASVATAGTGSIRISDAPPDEGMLSVGFGDQQFEARGVPLAEIMKALEPKRTVRIGPELQNRRYDASLRNEGSASLLDTFRDVAKQQFGIEIEIRHEATAVWVLRPIDEVHVPLRVTPYPADLPRSHFSCSHCGIEEIRRVAERNLQIPVIAEAGDLKFPGVLIEWLDEASLIAVFRQALGLDLSRSRTFPIWTVRSHPHMVP